MPTVESLQAQIALVTLLVEDIECRYSLACRHLRSLLGVAPAASGNGAYTMPQQPPPATSSRQTDDKTDEESAVLLAYQQCQALQLQLNVALRTLRRLHAAVDVNNGEESNGNLAGLSTVPPQQSFDESLRKASKSRLQCLLEHLLAIVVPLVTARSTLARLQPLALLDPAACSLLFRHVCVVGRPQMQAMCGVLLMRLCSSRGLWGDFVGSVFTDYFAHHASSAVPQDR